MLSIGEIVKTVLYLIGFCLIIGLLHYLVGILPIPDPYQGWIIIAIRVLAVLAIIGMLLQWMGYPIFKQGPPS